MDSFGKRGHSVREREWATVALAALARGESVQVRPRGTSMRGKIEDGALVALAPCAADQLAVGDVVLARVRGWLLVLHQVLGQEPGRVLIGTTAGREDGWVSADDVFGRVVAVQAAGGSAEQAEPV